MMDMKLSDVIKFVDNSGMSEEVINGVIQELREAFQIWVGHFISHLTSKSIMYESMVNCL